MAQQSNICQITITANLEILKNLSNDLENAESKLLSEIVTVTTTRKLNEKIRKNFAEELVKSIKVVTLCKLFQGDVLAAFLLTSLLDNDNVLIDEEKFTKIKTDLCSLLDDFSTRRSDLAVDIKKSLIDLEKYCLDNTTTEEYIRKLLVAWVKLLKAHLQQKGIFT